MPPLHLPLTTVSTATGTAQWTFAPVTMGAWWHVACIVPTAPTGAVMQLLVNGSPRFKWLGPLPSAAVVLTQGSRITVKATGLAKSTGYTALLTGAWAHGAPQGIPPQGPSSFAAVSNATFNMTTVHMLPIVATVGVFTGRVALTGTTTAVALIPATRTPKYWENMKIGWTIWSTEANTGTYIYIGDSAGGTPTGWARIPSGHTKLMGSFSVAWGNAWVARVAGKTGDHVNVWAA